MTHKTEMKVIDLTPTWSALLPAFIAVLEQGTPNGKQMVIEELRRMASAADRLNEIAKSTTNEA